MVGLSENITYTRDFQLACDLERIETNVCEPPELFRRYLILCKVVTDQRSISQVGIVDVEMKYS